MKSTKNIFGDSLMTMETSIWLHVWLAGGLDYESYFSIQLGISSSQLTFTPSFFREVETTNQMRNDGFHDFFLGL